MDATSPDQDFNLLSLRDLLDARDQFHIHLLHKPNVVGTAIGRYRIRSSDPWPDTCGPQPPAPRRTVHHATPRTLGNSEVRPYSWPAILVFVKQWATEFAHPEDAVPPAIYMPNGHKVPVCVIQADRDDIRPEGVANYAYPASTIGGGFPVLCDVQGQEHVASIACLVTDGHRTYALTNRHVAGEAGSPIHAMIGGNREVVGSAAALQISRMPFTALYPGWPGRNVYVDMDIGLIDIDDLNRWTTQVYGIGRIGELADFDTSNISLRLIGCPVIAHGAASRAMQGEIAALFYRFKSVAGFDYVSDLLIGPRTIPADTNNAGSLGTHPGDSGTLWLMDIPGAAPQPLAVQWGGQVFLDGGKAQASSYALATFLSTACNQLDVTPLRDWNTGLPDYWGAVGHYSIANKAIDEISSAGLKKLMSANLDRISFGIADITKKNMAGLSKRDFVPLADVPDMVWKVGPYKRGGMNSPEHANHFADMDRELSDGATLLKLCDGHPENVAVPVWQNYYTQVQQQFPAETESRGLLPFRVWQIYDAMVGFLQSGDVASFVCAAGIVSHYIGDACQPLHISYLFNGDPDKPDTDGKPEGTGVHASYEDDMVDAHVPEIMAGIDQRLAAGPPWPVVTGGHEAAVAVVGLMQKTFQAITPREIIDAFVPVEHEKPAARAAVLWTQLGDRTMDVMADGCFCLAQIWDSAWKEGGGDKIKTLAAITEEKLESLYRDPKFLTSYTLDTIGPVLSAPKAAVTKAEVTKARDAAAATPKSRRRRRG